MIIIYKMQYMGNKVETNMELIPFEDKFYDIYEPVHNECFYEMRKALDRKPYNFYDSIEQLEDKKDKIFLLMDGNELVGSVACVENEIDDLIVNKNYQRQGYGRKLLLFAINHIQKKNSKPITLNVAKWNKNAVNLYKQCGFKCIDVEEIA